MASVPVVPPAPDSLTSNDFPVLWPVGTRWADNDMFGHLNNAVYYQLVRHRDQRVDQHHYRR